MWRRNTVNRDIFQKLYRMGRGADEMDLQYLPIGRDKQLLY
jgi:hypothetical protein